MKIKKFIWVGGILVIFSVGLIFSLVDEKESLDLNEEIEAEAQRYTCPMHPQIIETHPGDCPICGMTLVPLKTENSDQSSHGLDSHAPMDLSIDRQQLIGVKFYRVEKKNLFQKIRAPGRIAFDPELYTAQSEYLEALKQWEEVKSSPLQEVKKNTREMIRSSRIRLKVLGLSDDQIKQLTQEKRQSEGLLLTGKNQENWVYADLFELDLPKVREGLSAQISAGFLGGKIILGKVTSVDQVVDQKTRTAKVRIKLLDESVSIRPGTYVSVEIISPLGEYLSVPLEALMDTGKETFVFIKNDNSKIEPRKVVTGYETDDRVALVDGVKEGEEVVVGANFMLDSESRLNAVINRSSDLNSEHHQHKTGGQ